jgi:hypothetical protein
VTVGRRSGRNRFAGGLRLAVLTDNVAHLTDVENEAPAFSELLAGQASGRHVAPDGFLAATKVATQFGGREVTRHGDNALAGAGEEVAAGRRLRTRQISIVT